MPNNLPDKWQALYQFWASFGIPAYDENSVPDEAEMPYITYESKTGNFDKPLALSAQIFYYSKSWADISQKADQIAKAIGYGYKIIKTDSGYLYITQGSPFAQRMSESSDMVRRIVINISAEYFTAD